MLDSIGLGFYLAGKSIMFYGLLFTFFFLIFSYFEIKASKRLVWISLLSAVILIVLMSFFQNSTYVFLAVFLWAWIILISFISLTIIFIKDRSFYSWKEKFAKNKKFLIFGVFLVVYLFYLQYRYYFAVTGFFRLKHANLLFDSFSILLFPF